MVKISIFEENCRPEGGNKFWVEKKLGFGKINKKNTVPFYTFSPPQANIFGISPCFYLISFGLVMIFDETEPIFFSNLEFF